MRRASTCLAVLGLAMLALSGTASATPTVTFEAKAVPIAGFPHTGNILGAGAAVQAEFTIAGTEYGGYSPPLIGVNVSLPTGAKIHSAGFPTCPTAVIAVEHEPKKCPALSKAGPKGEAEGFVVFGSERVPEKVSLESFYAAGGGINVYIEGHTPASIEIASQGHYVNINGGGGFGPRLDQQDQDQGRLGDQERWQDALLRHDAEEVPEGRLPREGRTEVRGARWSDRTERDKAVQGCVPQEVGDGWESALARA